MRLTDFPGGELIAEGLDDLRRGHESVPALLVSIGTPRLRRLGYDVPDLFDDAEVAATRCLPERTPTRHTALQRAHPTSGQLRPSCRVAGLVQCGSRLIASASGG